MKVRGEVSKALELARVAKVIGHSLDAAVAIKAQGETAELLNGYADELASIFIVSKVSLVSEISCEAYRGEGVDVAVTAAPGDKCERCWAYSDELGTFSDHPTLCPKCSEAVK
jgi:isoleucyl-tRNA synthetase